MAVWDDNEDVLKKAIRREKRYAKKRPFSEKPLTSEEFSKKYWLDGEQPYQYHGMRIEDGRDETEQLIINNVREIRNQFQKWRKWTEERNGELLKQIEEAQKETAHIKKQVKTMSMICAALVGLLVSRERSNTRASAMKQKWYGSYRGSGNRRN